MTVYYGSVTSTASGWKFEGTFFPRGGKPEFSIEGGLNVPIEALSIPFAELVNAKEGSFSFRGEVGPAFVSLRTTSLPEVIVLGKLAAPIAPTVVEGWLQIRKIYQ